MARPRLTDKYLENLPAGELLWIGLRPARKQAMTTVDQCMAVAGMGLEGDRRMAGRSGSARQVTLISREFIHCIEQHMAAGRQQTTLALAAPGPGHDVAATIDPAVLRRNLVVAGINLNALRYRKFRIGDAVFEATAYCHPCSRMESALGEGGFAAMMGFGGLCATVLVSGAIAVGDKVIPLQPED